MIVDERASKQVKVFLVDLSKATNVLPTLNVRHTLDGGVQHGMTVMTKSLQATHCLLAVVALLMPLSTGAAASITAHADTY